jgi:ATP-dependent RNA helicase RhlE
LPHVVNYELPNVPEQYVHRIGRTGRAGVTGEAISFVSGEEMAFLADIEKLMRRALPREVVPGFEPSGRPQPALAPRQAQAPRRNQPQRAQRKGGGERRRPERDDAKWRAPRPNAPASAHARPATHSGGQSPAREEQPQSNANAQFPSSGAVDRKYARPGRPKRGGQGRVPALLGGAPRR